MKDLKNQIAIVTGASRGIGAAMAEVLAREGCNVVLAARSVDAIQSLAERLHLDYGVQTLAVTVDMGDEQQVRDMVATTEKTFDGVDILVNNAGVGLFGSIDELKMADLRHVFDVNFFGAVAAMQAVAPSMRSRGGGVIVNVSSTVGKFPSPLGGGYSATKYALHAVSGAARAELAADNIDVIVICPGLTDTEFSRHARVSVPGAEEMEGERHAPVRGVSPMRVAERTLQAIRRGEREVYVTFLDWLLVSTVLMFPGLLDWGLRLAVWVRRRRFEQVLRQKESRPGKRTWLFQWPIVFMATGAMLLWLWRRK